MTKSVFCQIAHQLISTTPSFLEIGLCGSVEGLLLTSKLIYIGMYLSTMHYIHARGSLECEYFIKHFITFQVERGPAVPWVPSWTGQRFLGLQVERGNNNINTYVHFSFIDYGDGSSLSRDFIDCYKIFSSKEVLCQWINPWLIGCLDCL